MQLHNSRAVLYDLLSLKVDEKVRLNSCRVAQVILSCCFDMLWD